MTSGGERGGRRSGVTTVLSLALFLALVAATVYIALNPPCESFTEFYILGPGGKAAGYPTKLKMGEVGRVIVGVRNHECRQETYTVVAKLANQTVYTATITLGHNQTWTYVLEFRPTEPGRTKLELYLYKNNTTAPYRRLHLWVEVR
ncbi:MAG: DUF1616 domain-containing protein [Pyrobaculum sp.]